MTSSHSPDAGTPSPRTAAWSRWLGLGIAALGVAAIAWLLWDQDAFTAWKREAGPVPFFLAMAVLPAFGVPITPFFVMAGVTFGTTLGLVGSLLALAANLLLCYGIARSGLRSHLARWLRRFQLRLPDFEKDGHKALRFALLVKLAPGVPVFAKHYALVLAGVPFAIYFGVTWGIGSLYAAAFVVVGESLLEHRVSPALVAVGVLAAVALGVWWWRRRQAAAGAAPSSRKC